jgi:trk system potassium uptake protein TrkH
MFFEHKSVPHTGSQGFFMESLFEVVSAFGTVGLSAGLTPKLHFMGKLTLVITMFIGRVGLLTFAYSLARPAKQGEIIYLDEPVMIG